MTETSKENKKALENLNSKLLEIMNDRGVIASYLLSSLSRCKNPINTTQIKLVKDSNLKRARDLLIHNSISVTLPEYLLTFRVTGKKFDLKGDLLKMITNKTIMLIFPLYRINN